MNRIFILVLLSFATGCANNYNYLQAGIGQNAMSNGDIEWHAADEWGGHIGFGNRHQWINNLWGDLGFDHYSQPRAGYPYNDDVETSTDHLFYNLEYQFR